MLFDQTEIVDVLTPGVDSPVELPDTIKPGTAVLKEGIAELKELSLQDFLNDITRMLVEFAINVTIAILVFYLGKFIIKRIYNIVGSIMVRRRVDNSLATFVLSFIKIILYFILIVTVIGILGVETSSFLAIFASAGVAIGMALSGTLQNFAGGVLLLLLKPYKVGDYVEAQGFAGTVREIQIFHTLITTYDNKSILIPNGPLSTSSINNWSRESVRRVTWQVSISYGDSVDKAREAILAMFADDPRIIMDYVDKDGDGYDDNTGELIPDAHRVEPPVKEEEPMAKSGFWGRIFGHHKKVKSAIETYKEGQEESLKALRPKVTAAPVVLVDKLDDSSVNLSVRAWVKTGDYWNVFYDYNERIYRDLPAAGVSFPFPQLDVHLAK